MSIVVTAASGHLGRLIVHDLLRRGIAPDHVVDQLLAAGHNVTAYVRNPGSSA